MLHPFASPHAFANARSLGAKHDGRPSLANTTAVSLAFQAMGQRQVPSIVPGVEQRTKCLLRRMSVMNSLYHSVRN